MSTVRPPWTGGAMVSQPLRSGKQGDEPADGPARGASSPGPPGWSARSAAAPQPRLVTIRRRCGHEEPIADTGDPWLQWAHEQQRCARCTAAWLARPQCEGRCSTGLLDPSNDQL